jgi:hypothetical protein
MAALENHQDELDIQTKGLVLLGVLIQVLLLLLQGDAMNDHMG